MTYTVNPACLGSCFNVPTDIVDRHLRLASGEQIKVLLLILAKAPQKLSESDIAKALKYNLSDVEDYLQYWILTGVLKEDGEIKPEPEKFIPSFTSKDDTAAPAPEKIKKTAIEYSRPSLEEIAQRTEESAEIKMLFSELQNKLGKTIGYDGMCTFLLLHDRFGLPADVIFMLVEYCVSVGKTGYSYIESAGKNWAELEIDTIDKAAEKIASLDKVNLIWKKLTMATGIKNPMPTVKQTEFIEKWTNKLNMSFDMIYAAYEEMANHTSSISFSYMNKILENWYSKDIATVADINQHKQNAVDASKKQSGNSNASYDLEKYTDTSIRAKLQYKKKDNK